ncbi:sugar phosphate isomerase/epimerase family protein [Coraliomargarita akajimensis]|uniref:Xylose isomerase domain protein TIM barrel n=1 Tax=Coraliomargarita akajimensis (strain DSM 45221 / IAM 15411 / JCM 23193 / KCTC 12865 / 04OKA010-24) TaxID=583355 RepID=D5ENR6_CORAD|nr:TIM barrel protein [Coraliomargarita akajimensis]ADE53575.1 Xylose isomerase domain protein TIM barrel [Coraliomargarita akajimensis DSM 45221]
MFTTFLKRLYCLPLFATLSFASAAPEIFPFDNGFQKTDSIEMQGDLLQELGYDGICSRPGRATDELYAAMESRGLKVYASYWVPDVKYLQHGVPANMVEHIERLGKHGTTLWISLVGKDVTDEQAALAIRNLYDFCAQKNVDLVLYPHVGFYTDTVKTCARLRELSERPEVGLSFSLCHFLRQNPHEELEDTVRAIGPYLKLVQINGADNQASGGKGWSDLIKPLDEGSFEMQRLLKVLAEVGYDGPFNLQCYQMPAPARKHLSSSIQAWQSMHN